MVYIWNFKKIERKWQKKWEKGKAFESDIDKKAGKFFINIPYPYVNGAPHVGNLYTWSRGDVFARFKRMRGFNVLFPQGFHATGEPILGVIERLRKEDKVQIETLKQSGAKDSDIDKFKRNPKHLIKFFIKKWIEGLRIAGMSIDWRRTFVTTTLTPTYSRFIEWQYNTLKKKGYVIQGTHPVIWCPKCQSPTGDHDRLEGEGESPVEYVLLKFKVDDLILPAATLRPETIYGVTNMWLKPNTEYAKIKVGNETWVVSKDCAEKLKDQIKDVKVVENIKSNELFGRVCENPVTGNNVPILPSDFVKLDSATGVVMGVPSHAPYDWIALKEMIDGDELARYGFSKNDVEPISLIKVPDFGEQPAIELCEKMKITSLNQEKELDEATNMLYKKEFHSGILNDRCGEYTGTKVSECKNKLTIDFIEKNIADVMWECAGVICRCTTRCHVKILENQWFLKFSDENWKNNVRRCLSKMEIYPEEARNNFENTIDWLKDKACTRKTGLGTPLPWDKEWIVETLSDSTIYMAYYTISRIIKKNKIKADKLTDETFDFVFLGKGDINKLSKKTKLNKKLLKGMREEFEYFYPFDIRISAKDLIQNHLTFSLFHHAAIWPEKYWLRGFGLNGYVNIEREKMSKSKGNIISMAELVKSYGADLARINIVGSGEDMVDVDWRVESLKSYRLRFEFLIDTINNLKKAKGKKMRNAELYLQSKLQKNIKAAGENFEQLRFRTGLNHAFFGATNDLKWYLKSVGGMGGANRKVLDDFLSKVIKMISPFAPHICEEMWYKLGNKKMIIYERWPQYDEKLVNTEAELCEEMIRQTISDIEEIKKITKKKPKGISIFVAENWKFRVYNKILRNKDRGMNEITKEIMNTDARAYGKATVSFIQSLYKNLKGLKPIIPRSKQMGILNDARNFLKKDLGCKIIIADAERSTNPKAKAATPNKFGIYIE